MKVILVPGYWFNGSSWDRITPALEAAGHEVTALTLPGMESVDADRLEIGLADHVEAVVAAVDSANEPVVLVGSSFAGTLVQITADQRPGLVALAVYVDVLPKPVHGQPSDEPAGTEIAFSWNELTSDEQRDLTTEQRTQIEHEAIPFPAKVVRDGWTMTDERRYSMRSLIVASGFSAADLDEWRAEYPEVGAEIDAHTDLTLVELPTSHWPHMTRPDDFAKVLLDAI